MKNLRRPFPFFIAAFVALICTGSSISLKAQPAMGTTSFATATTITLSASAPCTAGNSGISNGYRFTAYSGANCAINNTAASANSDGHINLITTPTVTGIWQEGRIASSDGSQFQLDNFIFSALTTPFLGKTITVTGFRDNVAVPGATAVSASINATGLANTFTVNVASNTAFDNIDEIRLVPSGTDAQGTISIHSVTISPASILPLKFTSIRGTATTAGIKVNFDTEEEINVLNYQVQLSRNGTDFSSYKTLPARNRTFNQYETLLLGETGNAWIRIQSNDIDGRVQYSEVIYLRNGSGSPATTDALVTYPNPARHILFVDNRENQLFTISSLQGTVLQKGKIVNGQVNLAGLTRGVYILKINQHSVKIYKD